MISHKIWKLTGDWITQLILRHCVINMPCWVQAWRAEGHAPASRAVEGGDTNSRGGFRHGDLRVCGRLADLPFLCLKEEHAKEQISRVLWNHVQVQKKGKVWNVYLPFFEHL